MAKLRKQIEQKYIWDLTPYYQSDDDWQASFDKISLQFDKLKQFDKALTNKQNILQFLQLTDKVESELISLLVYASLKNDEDLANSKYQQMNNLIENLAVTYSSITSFATPQLSSLDNSFLEELIQDKDFRDYDMMFKRIISKKSHILDERQEKLLSGVGAFSSSFHQTFSNFENADLKFKKVKDKDGNELDFDMILASKYLRQSDRVLRKNAYDELKGAFGRYNNFLYSNYLSNIKATCFFAKARNFNTSLQSALFYEEVDKSVYDNLIKSVNANLKLDYRFFELKRKILNVDKFAIYDIYYNPIKAPTNKYTYADAIDLVLKATNVLRDKYTQILSNLLYNRRVDVMPTKNKRSGAYSTGAYNKPPIVLLNFDGKYDDVSTLAHEMGHSMHTFLSNSNQPFAKAEYTIFLAEIASTVNECLLNRYMLNNAKNKQEKMYYILEFLSTFHATVYRQTMFAEYEEIMHDMYENNKPLSAKIFNDEYYKLVKKYFGPKVECPKSAMYEWSSIPHFYTDFYVYKYATGLISAIAIVNNILSKGEIAVDGYLKFLSSGSSSDPISILKYAGVDLTDPKTFNSAFDYIKTYIDTLQSLINE